jgi:AcrR family transcriptional regulator
MALYTRTSDEARTLVPAALENARDVKKRLRAVVDTKFQQFADHRRLLGALVRIGMDPKHPLSPFAKETETMRLESIGYFRDALAGTKVPKDLAEFLPGLFWFYQLGLILFWIYDESPGQRKTKLLTDATLDIAVRLIQLSSLPLMGTVRKRVIALLNDVLE